MDLKFNGYTNWIGVQLQSKYTRFAHLGRLVVTGEFSDCSVNSTVLMVSY